MSLSVVKTSRWDWYLVPFEWGKEIGQTPGVQYKSGAFHVHRTHLPLLRHRPGVDALIADVAQPIELKAPPGEVTLRPWQKAGLDWIGPRRGVLVADEMRLGKTAMALHAHDPTRGPLVVVGPLDTRPVWVRWMKTLWPDVEPTPITGKTVDRERLRACPILFGHYDILKHHQVTSLRASTLIIDEGHLLSNPRSDRTKAVLFYASIALRTIVLTGTPLWNRPEGLWGLLAAAAPGAWGRLFEFSQRYAGPEMTEYGWRYRGVSNRGEWEARRSEFFLARTWSEVRPDLPKIQRKIVKIPLAPEQMFEVDVAAAELMTGSKNLDVTVLGRYRQACGKYKVGPAAELAVDHVRTGRPILLWVWHKSIGRAIAKAIGDRARVFMMTGDDAGPKRAATIEAWNDDPSAVMIATWSVGQVGIDLSHTDEEIAVEVDWTPAVMSQGEMRPFNGDRPTYATYLVLDHEVDQLLLETVIKKVERGRSYGLAAAGSSFEEVAEETDQSAAVDLLRDLADILLRGS